MCGIAGIYHFEKQRPINTDRLKKMADIIQYRGPDGEGFYVDQNIGLGHRRLSIIDLQTGDQPMLSDDKQKALVFNGEIYNYIELRQQLKQKGYVFRTDSDTEVVIKAYEEWGYECQNKFNGMWAFALWDKSKQELFLSRDRIGEKPLHYSTWDNTFIFGSEMKSLFAYGIPKSIDSSLIEIYLLMTNIPEPNTFYKNIKKLEAGHYLVVRDGNIKDYKYWDLPNIDEKNMIKDKGYVYEKFDSLFRDSVKIRMRADVPFGAFLSGGLDSSAIVSVMAENSNYPINTFTIGFPEKDFDESKLAEEVAKKFGTNHYTGTVDPDNFNDIIQRVAFHYDEPFGDSSAIPTGYVSKFAREKVKMVLTGDGGDEVLSGYNSFTGIKIAQKYNSFPEFARKNFPRFIKTIKQPVTGKYRLILNKIQNVSETSILPFNQRMVNKRAYTDFSMIKKLTNNISGTYPVEDYFSDLMNKCPYNDEFYKLMFLNFKNGLPNDYLVKVDRMSMANSLETRVPFLDYRLVEFMVNVDKNVKMQGWERKSILRKTIGKSLPDSILTAPKKGFGIPLREWFKDDSISNSMDQNLMKVKNVLDECTLNQIVLDNKNGLRDNGNFIWSMIMLDKLI
ncbi:asparagine synthase (glutamine-hydrolyzing) [Ulvibacter sp.]|nr:asparagine synthase (glutamine-hydrolyzing) [Ulvibacter sp.]